MVLLRLAKNWKFLTLTLMGAALVVLELVNIRAYSANRAQRADVAARQQYINESIQLSRFNAQFVQALANMAAQTSDESLRQILLDQGISYTVTPAQADAPEQPDE